MDYVKEAHLASLSFMTSRSLLRLIFIELVMLSNHLILCHPFLLLPSFSPSIGVFSNEWVNSSHQVAEVLESQFLHQSLQWIFCTENIFGMQVSLKKGEQSSETKKVNWDNGLIDM